MAAPSPSPPVTSTVTKPILTVLGKPYTAEGSIIVVEGQTLTFGSSATLSNVASQPQILLVSGGTRAVINGITQALTVTISTETTIQTGIPSTSGLAPTSPTSSPTSSASTPAIKPTTLSSEMESTSTSSSTLGVSTSTEPATSSSTPSSHQSSRQGISPGASAGIGIGCAAAGALIAAFLVFFLLRKRPQNNRHDAGEFTPTEKSPSSFKQADNPTRSLDPGSSAFAIAERDLPLPLEDAAIAGELSRLQTLIKNYAQSYYHASPVASQNADLGELGSNLPIPASRLASMLADPRTRIAAIRFCLMWVITSRVALNSEHSQSLLPLEVTSVLRLMPGAKDPNSPPSFPPWRALTHRLLSPSSHPLPTTTTSPSSPTPNAASLQLARTTLDNIFQPYADPSRDSYERMSKLEGILERGARFGWMLFGQMSELGVEWLGEREQGRLVLVEREMGKGTRGGGLGKGARVLWEGEEVRWGG